MKTLKKSFNRKKKKKIYRLTLVVLAVMIVAIGSIVVSSFGDAIRRSFVIFAYQNSEKESYNAIQNVPQFYGMTKAIVQKNSEFDIKSAHLRIFARDVEDGDLTYKIVVKSNNVDTSNLGNYEIVYEVTDSDNNVKSITVPVEVVENDQGATYQRTVYSLPSVDHMSITGPRGNQMDRQITGLMLRANAKIRIKLVSGPGVTAQIYSTNAGSKGDRALTTSYQNFTYSNISTVFIKTPFKVNGPSVIEINVPEGEDVIEMPYYRYKDDEEKFRTYWNSIEGSSVGVIENQSVLFYFLPMDKNNFKNFGTIDKGLEFFDALMDEYDELLGYDYYAEDPWNQNVKTKYFISGGGANNGSLAYYGTDQVTWAGSSTPTGNAFAVGWASLHEIAHGYQGGGLKEDGGMGLIETSNNILGHYVQVRSDLKNQVGGDWLGSLPSIEDAINNSRLNGTTFRQLGAKSKLYVLVNLLEMYDYKEAYSHLARLVRELNYKGQGGKYSLAEKYVLTYHQLYGVNVSSYFEAWGENISQTVKEIVKNDKTVTMIKDAVNDEAKIAEIRNDLGKSGKYSLVTSEELAKYELEGIITLKFEIDNIEELIGKEILLSDGLKTYIEKVTGTEMNITLPAGSYQITVPTPKNNVYTFSTRFNADVKNGQTTNVSVSYQHNVNNVIELATEIYLYGQMYGSWTSSVNLANIKFNNKNVVITYENGITHAGFAGQNYIKIEVLDLEGNAVYSRAVNGGSAATGYGVTSVPYEIGYKVVVYHAEATGGRQRLQIRNRLTGTTPANLTIARGSNTYIIGEYGLYQEDNNYENFKKTVDEYAEKLLKELTAEELANKNAHNTEKGVLLTAIYKLKEEDQKEYLEKYKYIYNGSAPQLSADSITLKVGDDASLIYQTLKGTDVEDKEFALNSDNFTLAEFSTAKAGEYSVEYTLKDLDANETTGTLLVKVEDKEEEKPDDEYQECPVTPPQDETPVVPSRPNNSGSSNNSNTVVNVKPSSPNVNTPIDDSNDDNLGDDTINIPDDEDEKEEKNPSSTDKKPVTTDEQDSTEEKKSSNYALMILIIIILLCLIGRVIIKRKK